MTDYYKHIYIYPLSNTKSHQSVTIYRLPPFTFRDTLSLVARFFNHGGRTATITRQSTAIYRWNWNILQTYVQHRWFNHWVHFYDLNAIWLIKSFKTYCCHFQESNLALLEQKVHRWFKKTWA